MGLGNAHRLKRLGAQCTLAKHKAYLGSRLLGSFLRLVLLLLGRHQLLSGGLGGGGGGDLGVAAHIEL